MPKSFRVYGVSDDVTTCECCGKPNLKSTVMMAELDADGNAMGIVHYGSSCAANAANVRGLYITKALKTVETKRYKRAADPSAVVCGW